MAKVGKLGLAVYDCILAGVCPSVLVGRVEFGSPSLYRVKAGGGGVGGASLKTTLPATCTVRQRHDKLCSLLRGLQLPQLPLRQ